jgi:hypothetical protein
LVNVIHTYGMEVTMCLGPSMLPTFNHRGDVVLMERVSVLVEGVENGDVVISRSPANPKHTVCKRVLGRTGRPHRGSDGGQLRGLVAGQGPERPPVVAGGQQR